MKNTKKSLLTSALCLLLCMSMLVGTTFAWFTDEVKSGNNIIQAGNLDVELEYAKVVNGQITGWDTVAGQTAIFDPNALWEPGRVEVVYLKVSNLGTLELKYQLGVNVYKEITGKTEKNEDINLSEHLVFKVVEMPDALTTYTDREAVQLAAGTEKGLKDYNGNTTKLEVGGADYVALIVYMPETVGNEANYRGTAIPTIELGINLFATQKDAESDSFGPDYDEDAWNPGMKVYGAQDLQAAINNGIKNIELMADIQANETIIIPQGAEVELNLNGKTLTGSMHKNDGAVINNKGNLKLINGTVSSTANNGGSAIMNSGNAVLEEVTLNGAPNADGSWPSYTVNNTGVMTVTDTKITSYHGAVASYGEGAIVTLNNSEIDMAGIPGFTSHGIYTYNNGAVVVNGGEYANKATDQNASGASVINGAVTINGGTFSGRIENYYGNPVIQGGTFSVKPNAKFITAGYKAVANTDGTYSVIFPQESFDNLIENAGENATIEIPAGEYTFPASDLKAGQTLNCAPGTVFEGQSKLNINGATVIGATFSNPTGTAADQTINGTFKNCTFTGKNALRWCYAGDTVVFENCTFNATSVYAIHFDGLTGKNVSFINCEITGWVAIAGGANSLTFDGCTINGNGTYGLIRSYSNATIKNCTFDVADVNTTDAYQDGIHAVGCTITVENCTNVNGAIEDIFNISSGGVINKQ